MVAKTSFVVWVSNDCATAVLQKWLSCGCSIPSKLKIFFQEKLISFSNNLFSIQYLFHSCSFQSITFSIAQPLLFSFCITSFSGSAFLLQEQYEAAVNEHCLRSLSSFYFLLFQIAHAYRYQRQCCYRLLLNIPLRPLKMSSSSSFLLKSPPIANPHRLWDRIYHQFWRIKDLLILKLIFVRLWSYNKVTLIRFRRMAKRKHTVLFFSWLCCNATFSFFSSTCLLVLFCFVFCICIFGFRIPSSNFSYPI